MIPDASAFAAGIGFTLSAALTSLALAGGLAIVRRILGV